MKKKDVFLAFCLLVIGFSLWLFPKAVDPELFLGFSEPLILTNQDQSQGPEEDQPLRKPAERPD